MDEKVPRLLAGVDIRKFKLDAMDGFLLTRIDGKLGAKDLSRETGLPDFSVARIVEKLEKLGVVEMIDPKAPPPPPPPPPPPVERKTAVAQFDAGLLAPKYDPSELEEAADLPPEQKKRILDFYYRLEDLDHYTLLGITKEAEKKGVKRAYFELAALFHPDRYYKKQLGSFKAKMEALFNRITEAHDTLVDASKRRDYDAYLAEVATTRGMEAMLERAMAESANVTAEAERALAAEVPVSIPPSPPSAPTSVPTAPTAEDIQRRKEALARRLMGGKSPAASRPSPVEEKPAPHRFASTQDAMDALKRRYQDRIESATQAHAAKYVSVAEDALAKNDLVAASTAFSLAAKFAPDDQALAVRAQEVKNLSDVAMADSYHKQATYEEKQGHWFEAAKSWLKVARIRNDAVSHERAANAIWRSPDGDLRLAAEHAKAAIGIEPTVVGNHITLIEIYLKAGLETSAKRATEAAHKLDPSHAALHALAKRIAKG